MKKKFIIMDLGALAALLLTMVYLLSIFAINIKGSPAVDTDIYPDAILAKYIAQSGILFPEGWHFGNQIYVVATPVIAAFFYPLTGDSYSALAIASCVMTAGVVLSYIWCLKPFAKMQSILISLLVVLGGTNISYSAVGDPYGLQVFYTMASYYACYVIGILVTLGLWLRYMHGLPVKKTACAVTLLLNFALGMQSLREMLVLNLPLCAVMVLQLLLERKPLREHSPHRKAGLLYAAATMVANLFGILGNKVLLSTGMINQHTILQDPAGGMGERLRKAVDVLIEYVGFVTPDTPFATLKFAAACISVLIVLGALACGAAGYFRNKKIDALGYTLLFFVISLMAVFASGLLFLELRPIYYFCWHFLVAFSAVHLLERKREAHPRLLKGLSVLLTVLLLYISAANYQYAFGWGFAHIKTVRTQYQDMITWLQSEDISYLYSDHFTYKHMLGAMTEDEITYVAMYPSGKKKDLWKPIPFLYHEEWFEPENFENAYIILSAAAHANLEASYSQKYVTALMDNLELVREFAAGSETFYFYRGSDKLFADMVN